MQALATASAGMAQATAALNQARTQADAQAA
jgi:hypothetical protein